MKSLFVPVGQGEKREAITNCNTGHCSWQKGIGKLYVAKPMFVLGP